MMGPLAAPSFADTLRAQFFQLGVPLLITDAPGGGALAQGDYGESYHFTTPDQVQFFLLGFKLGQQTAHPEPIHVPADAEFAGYAKETGE